MARDKTATKAADTGIRTGETKSHAQVDVGAIAKKERQEADAYKARLRDSVANGEKSVKVTDRSNDDRRYAVTQSDGAIDKLYSIMRHESKTTESSKEKETKPNREPWYSGLLSKLNDLKIPIAVSAIALAADRVLTYTALASGFLEANPLVLLSVSAFGLAGGLVFSGAIVIGAVLAADYMIERHPVLKDRIKRNSVAKALLYGIAGAELIATGNNFLTLTQLYPALNLISILGPTATIAVLGAALFLPAAIMVARQVLKIRRENIRLQQRINEMARKGS
jgi:hypothetical protein